MGRALVFVVLIAIAWAAPAQKMFKCKQDDGVTSYQQLPCATADQQQDLKIVAPPPPTPVQTRSMVQAFDPGTGAPTEAWHDGPAPPNGAFYITREFRTVVDPQTGIPRQALVDVRNPVPQPPAHVYPQNMQPRKRPLQFSPTEHYYSPDAQERAENSVYEKAKCRATSGRPC